MTPDQKSAYINAQAALLNAEIAMMQAENTHRELCGNSIAYGGDEFQKVIDKYEFILGHNAVIERFRS